MIISRWMRRALALGLLFSIAPLAGATLVAGDSQQFQQQRELFVQTRQQLAGGQTTLAASNLRRLADYPLYPYLELAQLKQRLRALPYADVDAFFVKYAESVVSERLREAWLAQLAFQNRWQAFLRYHQTGFGPAYECWRIEALHHTGKPSAALDATEKVWLVGRSLPDQCDPAIKRWLASERDAQPLIWKRMLLALERGEVGLGRYLASKLRGTRQQVGQQALELARDARLLKRLLPSLPRNELGGDVATLALQQLARRDADAAEALWDKAGGAKLLSPGQHNVVRRELGRQRIAALGQDALPWLLHRDPAGEDDYLLEWRIRLALRTDRWNDILAWTDQLPVATAATPRWQYWRARALLEQSTPEQRKEGRELLASIAADRSYYGFLASDLVGTPYTLDHEPMKPTVTSEAIATDPGLRRVREFYQLGERISASREWSRTFDRLSAPQRQAATLLAQSWGWHIQAIRSAADAGGWNDLGVRFPLAFEQQIRKAAKSAQLSPEWLFAVARQESAFIPDARSSAGAMGLLQLLPGTARQVAASLGTPLRTGQLIDPGHSARLGGAYLQELLSRYEGNRVLATAAYNAGPGRISRWLRTQPDQVSADVWVETLPYRETRDYVQNVLAYAVIYAHHLGAEQRLLADGERVIGNAAVQISRNEERE